MNFARLQFRAETLHHMLVLFNSAQSFEGLAFDHNFPMIGSPREIEDFNRRLRVELFEALFHLLLCHASVLPEDDLNNQPMLGSWLCVSACFGD